jgi:uncharacterized membrane protein
MGPFIVVLAIYLIAVLLILPLWTIMRVKAHGEDLEALRTKIRIQDADLASLKSLLKSVPIERLAKTPEASAEPTRDEEPKEELPPFEERYAQALESLDEPKEVAQTAIPEPELEPVLEAPPILGGIATHAALEERPPEPEPIRELVHESGPRAPAINWEQFMGAKLFAWLGGLALFLGVAFFVKYSFEHDLIPPQVRVAMGFILGVGLIVGGLKISREAYGITSQTLVASGVVSLYAVTFAANSVYHFAYFGPLETFLMMSLITAAAFVLAVRLDAQVVAVLGILGGFLTPKLLNSGHDNPAGLFGYVALLVIGLIAVALHRKWLYLIPLGAAGTVLMICGWADNFYAPEKTVTAMVVCLGYCALFTAATEVARRMGRDTRVLGRTAIALPALAFCFALYFLSFPQVADQAGLIFSFVLGAALFTLILAWREKMDQLVFAAAAFTALVIARWLVGSVKVADAPVVVAVCLGFSALFLIAYVAARRLGRAGPAVLWSAVGMPAVGLVIALYMIVNLQMGSRPGLVLGLVFGADLMLLAVAWLDEENPELHVGAGAAVFALLSVWTMQSLTDPLLKWSLSASLLFAILHTAFPIVLERRRPGMVPSFWKQIFPPLALILMMFPIYSMAAVSFLVWPAILLVDLVAIALAVVSASLMSVAAVLVLTLAATGMSIFRGPVDALVDPSLLLVIGGFALLFFIGGLWLVRKMGGSVPSVDPRFKGLLGSGQSQIPAFSALLPFLLLIMVCARLRVPDPSMVFGLGFLLVVLTLGLSVILELEWLPACALAGIASLEYMWHTRHFNVASATVPLTWYLVFYASFAVFPFIFRAKFVRMTGPWAVAALSGVAHFWMTYETIKLAWPSPALGLIPAAFAVAPLVSLALILRSKDAENPAKLNQLAWFGGVALFFITLIFPVQFDRQWLTVAWALEGAALLWLYHRVPHAGLRATGFVLLVTAFARLALNPAVLEYHTRGAAPLLNWYLYAYGLAIASLFTASRLLAPPRESVFGINAQSVTYALGVVLSFLLLNIEIADYFTAPGSRSRAFDFSGNFARDMCYTIAWALFALGLLAAGIWKKQPYVRYAAIALLSVALLKLFFNDLAHLEALYRVGALFAVAVIAIVASFAYQRFLPSNEKRASPPA